MKKKTSGSRSGNKRIFYVLDEEARRRGETGRIIGMSCALCGQLENAIKKWIKDGQCYRCRRGEGVNGEPG